MIYFLLFTNCVLLAAVVFLVRRQNYLLDDAEQTVESVEECLDILDQNYKKMSKFLETPVLFDDPIAMEFVQSAKDSRDALLVVANRLVAEREET